LGATAIWWPIGARSALSNPPKIGVLLVGNREPFWREFTEGLRQTGYVEGQNLQIIFRTAEGNLALLPRLAAELVELNVDILVASETPAVHAAKQASRDIPIVMAPSGDPVGTGLVESLAKPGGNVTGLSAATAELAGKSLELIREILPAAHRVAALADPSNAFTKPFMEQIELGARSTGFNVQAVMVRDVTELEAIFSQMPKQSIDAVVVQPTLPRAPVIAMLQRHRMPAVSGNRAFVDAGGLLSYAGSLADRYKNAAPYIDKILKGAKPADLPVQQPIKFELVLNLKTAKALGLVIPSHLIARADEVIE
jgi:putative ABC transport system substrate-binding protein